MNRRWKITWVDCGSYYETIREEHEMCWANMPWSGFTSETGRNIPGQSIIKIERLPEAV